jgi:superfamily II DNA/RNA helicase
MGYHCPTLVQQRSLDTILDGRDVLLHAQTGSGKTLAFLLPMLADVDPSRASVQGIVVVPTRELGLQVASVAKRLAGRSPMVMSVLEGSRNARQRAWASAAPPHIVIGNPDNLSALVESGAIKCHAVRMVVVDEVDACLASGANRKSLHELLSRHLSPTAALDGDDGVADPGGSGANAGQRGRRRLQHRQTVFASATVPQRRHFVRYGVESRFWVLRQLDLA